MNNPRSPNPNPNPNPNPISPNPNPNPSHDGILLEIENTHQNDDDIPDDDNNTIKTDQTSRQENPTLKPTLIDPKPSLIDRNSTLKPSTTVDPTIIDSEPATIKDPEYPESTKEVKGEHSVQSMENPSSPLTDVEILHSSSSHTSIEKTQSNDLISDNENDTESSTSNQGKRAKANRNDLTLKSSKPPKAKDDFSDRASSYSRPASLNRFERGGATGSEDYSPLMDGSEEGVMLPGRKRPVPPSQINVQDRSGRTLIFKYAANGDYAITEALLRAGASLRISDYAGWTPLHEACLAGHERVVELLLSYDADVDAPGGDGDTPLHDAVGNGHFKVVALLLKHGASLLLHNEHQQTAEEFAIEKLEDLKTIEDLDDEMVETAQNIVDILQEWKEMIDKVVQRNNDGQTIFHIACSQGDVDRVLKLLDYGADINASDNAGWTPIHNAALHGHYMVAEVLLRYGSEVDPTGIELETPLHDAVANGHIECASLLLQYGAEPFRKNKQGKTPIDLVPETSIQLKELLNHPLEYWQPIKIPEYHPRLLGPSSGPTLNTVLSKPVEPFKAPAKLVSPHLAWGSLEAKGSFESSREEKKFHALLKTLEKTTGDQLSEPIPKPQKPLVEKKTPNHRVAQAGGESSSRSASAVPEKISKAQTSHTSPDGKKRVSDDDARSESKRPRPAERGQADKNPVKKTSGSGKEKESVKKLKEAPGVKEPKQIDKITKPVASASETAKKPAVRVVKPVERPKPPPKPQAPPSKLHLALAEISKEEEAKLASKKKKRFMISGYQAAGESSNEVSSESIVVNSETDKKTDNIPSAINTQVKESLSRKASSAQSLDSGKPHIIEMLKPVDPKSASSTTDLSKRPIAEKVDLSKKLAAEKKHCLPLCAFIKPHAPAPYFKPINISREGLWGDLPKQDHTKVFVDMQLAFCLGLSSGRQLLDKYPNLTSRVATTIEKTAFEATIVSHRLFSTMLLTIDPAWIQSTTVNGLQSLKLADIDIHIIFWSEELFRILNSHISSIEGDIHCPLGWIQDEPWPLSGDDLTKEASATSSAPKSYVHKLKSRLKEVMGLRRGLQKVMKKLGPIYEAIDNERYDLAMKICDKALKKDQGNDHQTIKALKSLAMGRYGLYQAAYDLAYEVKQTKPTDAPTLQAVFMTFKMLHMYQDIVDLYSTAYTLSPGNEEWANHWFMALARKGDWKALQQAAVKINKEFKNPKYYFWMAMAIYLQGLEPDSKNQSLLFTLAERMMAKGDTDGKIKDFETLQLYVLILNSSGKYSESLSLLEGPYKSLCKVEIEQKKMCIELLSKLDDSNEQIIDLCRTVLDDNIDDWLCHTALIDSSLKLGTEFSDVLTYLKSLQDSFQEKGKRPVRGPYLAEIYAMSTFNQLGNYLDLDILHPGNLVGAILKYIQFFGKTLCCFDDLYPFLNSIPKELAPEMIESLHGFLDPELKGERGETRIDQTRINLTILKIERYLKSDMGRLEFDLEVESLLRYYHHSLDLKVNDERERQYGDDYIVLASHAILEEYFVGQKSSIEPLVEAIVLLEYGLLKSKFNHVFKILLIRLYMEIGISQRALDLANSLDIKNIQFDTLSYLYTDGLENLGQNGSIVRILQTTLGIYDRNEIETPEMILQAFKFGTFSKIPEFIDFKRNLQFSIQRATTHRQLNRVSLLSAHSWIGFIDKVNQIDINSLSLDGKCPFLDFSRLSDNRDTTLLSRYTSSAKTIMSDIRGEQFPLGGNDWLQVHNFVPLLYQQLFNNKTEGAMVSISDLSEFLEACTTMDPMENLALYAILQAMKSKAGHDVSSDVSKIWDDLQAFSDSFENDDAPGHFTYELSKKITVGLEAYNAAIALCVIVEDSNKTTKSRIVKQLKQIRKFLVKKQSICTESQKAVTLRLLPSNSIRKLEVSSHTIEFIQRGWENTILGLLVLVDGRISMLK